MLTVNTIPLWDAGDLSARRHAATFPSFTFSVKCVASASTTEFLELEPIRRVLFVLGRHVIALFALSTL
jgi:hypothetical protein